MKASPMTFMVDGKQYVAVAAGPVSFVSASSQPHLR
jgi:hypothetical protein